MDSLNTSENTPAVNDPCDIWQVVYTDCYGQEDTLLLDLNLHSITLRGLIPKQ